MVALTYEVRTLRIPIPRLVLRSSRARLARRVPEPLEPWRQTERREHEKRRDAHLDAAVALRR